MIQSKEEKMADLPDGLDDGAMMSAIAWQIVNFAYLHTAYFNEKPSDEAFVMLTNEFIRARQAIYHGKPLEKNDKSLS